MCRRRGTVNESLSSPAADQEYLVLAQPVQFFSSFSLQKPGCFETSWAYLTEKKNG